MAIDQQQLVDIFVRLKAILKTYENSSPLTPQFDLDSRYDLWSYKDLVIQWKKITERYFAGLIIQSSYVWFYFMPIYCNPELVKPLLHPDLLKLLKGKSCFHIKKLDDELLGHISDALAVWYGLYQEWWWL